MKCKLNVCNFKIVLLTSKHSAHSNKSGNFLAEKSNWVKNLQDFPEINIDKLSNYVLSKHSHAKRPCRMLNCGGSPSSLKYSTNSWATRISKYFAERYTATAREKSQTYGNPHPCAAPRCVAPKRGMYDISRSCSPSRRARRRRTTSHRVSICGECDCTSRAAVGGESKIQSYVGKVSVSVYRFSSQTYQQNI